MSGSNLPRISVNTQSTESSDDEHFSSASEGTPHPHRLSTDGSQSPIPITRVERVDDTAAHGEVPGTPAYAMRTQDAVPDEVEIVPEGARPRSGTQSRSRSHSTLSASSRPQTPGGTQIPKTVVERVDDKPAYGEVDGTLAKEMRVADAEPDEIRQSSPAATLDGRSQPTSEDAQIERDPEDQQAWFRSMWEGKAAVEQPVALQDDADKVAVEDADQDEDDFGDDQDAQNDDDFGDDFDEFAEEAEDDDFGDFDDATPAAEVPPPSVPPLQDTSSQNIFAGLPSLELPPDVSASTLDDTITPYLDMIFPDSSPPPSNLPPLDMTNSSPFLSERSLSLWQQLVSPPPMQPPNWTRSRIRRLFLVSLGVPVDLDEILPPSKQKRLVLPNINLASPRASTTALERIKQGGANDSSTSVNSKSGASKRSKTHSTTRGIQPPPDFDSNAAVLICRTTDEALNGFTDDELKHHLFTLEDLNRKSSSVLEYWLQRKDDGLKEKEALEGVIENLVGFVKGRRGK